MSSYITFEIQGEIIKKLPVKSVIQFRSVSKAWKALIDSAEFIAAYSVRCTQHLLIRYEETERYERKYVSFVDDDTFPQQKLVPTVPSSIELLHYSGVVGSSGGLFCFYGFYPTPDHHDPDCGKDMAVLWNPSIRKTVAIELPEVNQRCAPVLGFGVCPVTNDPKIVRFTWSKMKGRKKCFPWEIEVYTLRLGEWRAPSCNLPRQSVEVTWCQVVVDRFIYWLALDAIAIPDGFWSSYTIVTFDLNTDQFSELCLPDSLTRLADKVNISKDDISISKVWESLAVLEYIMDTDNRICVVWMMEDGVSKSFTKLFTIKTPYGSIRTLGFRKSGEPIMERPDFEAYYAQVALVVYEPHSEHIKDLDISGMNSSFSMNSYMETLLLLNQ